MDLLWTGASSNVSAVTQYQTIYLCTSPGCRWCPTVQNNIRKLSQLHLSSVRLKYSTTVRQLATFSLNNMSSVRWWPSLFTMNYIYSPLCVAKTVELNVTRQDFTRQRLVSVDPAADGAVAAQPAGDPPPIPAWVTLLLIIKALNIF